MKTLFNFFALITFVTVCSALESHNHESLIQPYANEWNNRCITQLSTQDIITISHTILLSYEIVQASLIMSQARLIIQEELLKVITLSINDTFDVSVHAQNNDFTKMKRAISDLEQGQEQIKSTCVNLKTFLPLLISIDPSTIQLLISNFKSIILHWVKTQEHILNHLESIKNELSSTSDLFIHVNNMFQSIITTDPIEHSQLLQGANSITHMYNKIENTIAHLTTTRQQGVTELDTLLTLFFKYHYEILYNQLEQQYENAQIVSYESLPSPDHIFMTV